MMVACDIVFFFFICFLPFSTFSKISIPVPPDYAFTGGFFTMLDKSPLLNNSSAMSDPPMNSPPTYSCGIVGHIE